MKVFVLGKVRGSNRSQHVLTYLNNRKSTQIVEPIKISIFRSQRLNRLAYFLFGFYLYDLFRAFKCDKIFYLAMNDHYLLFLMILRLFNKEIILDFYTSRLLFLCDEKKLNEESQRCSFRRRFYLYFVDKLRLTIPSKVIFLTEMQVSEHAVDFKVPNLSVKSHIIPLVVPSNEREASVNFESFNICWWGKASAFHGLEFILSEIAIAKKSIPKLKLFMFDDNPERAKYISDLVATTDLAVEDVVVRSDLTFTNGLRDWLQKHCTVALGTFGFSVNSASGVANKTIEAWSMKLPIVAQATPDVIDQPGFLSTEFTTGLSSLIIELYRSRSLDGRPISSVLEQGYARFERDHSKDAFETRIENVLQA